MKDEPADSRIKKFVEEYECIKRNNGEPCRMNGAEILKIIKNNDFENIVKLTRVYEDYHHNCRGVEAKMLSVFTVGEFYTSVLPDIKKLFQAPYVWLTIIEGSPLASMTARAMERENIDKNVAFIRAAQFESFFKKGCNPLFVCNYTSPYMPFFPKNNNFTIRSMAIMPLTIDGVLVGSMNFGHFVSNRFSPDMDASLIEHFMLQVSSLFSKISAHEQLRYLNHYDPLTGLLNRKALMAELNRNFGRSLHKGKGLSVLFMDLDGFNGLNDLYGHDYGDKAVQYTAEIILSMIRPEDIAARFTGDEFALILPGARGDIPVVLASRVQDYLDENPFDNEGIRFRLSLHYGIASIDEKNIENAGQLLQTAYKRLKESRELYNKPSRDEGKALVYKIRAS